MVPRSIGARLVAVNDIPRPTGGQLDHGADVVLRGRVCYRVHWDAVPADVDVGSVSWVLGWCDIRGRCAGMLEYL